MRIIDWSSDVCSSDLLLAPDQALAAVFSRARKIRPPKLGFDLGERRFGRGVGHVCAGRQKGQTSAGAYQFYVTSCCDDVHGWPAVCAGWPCRQPVVGADGAPSVIFWCFRYNADFFGLDTSAV